VHQLLAITGDRWVAIVKYDRSGTFRRAMMRARKRDKPSSSGFLRIGDRKSVLGLGLDRVCSQRKQIERRHGEEGLDMVWCEAGAVPDQVPCPVNTVLRHGPHLST